MSDAPSSVFFQRHAMKTKAARRSRPNRKSLRTLDPARFAPSVILDPPPPANVTEVDITFGEQETVWHFDQPVSVESGATGGTWGLFRLREDGGSGAAAGVTGVATGAQTVKVTMDAAPQDNGNGWLWELSSIPPKLVTPLGGHVAAAGGDATVMNPP